MFSTPRMGEKLIMLLPLWMGVAGSVLAFYLSDPFRGKVLFGLGLVFFGIFVFFLSKKRTITEGNLTSFGMQGMNPREKKFYVLGYFFMTVGLCFEIYLSLI